MSIFTGEWVQYIASSSSCWWNFFFLTGSSSVAYDDTRLAEALLCSHKQRRRAGGCECKCQTGRQPRSGHAPRNEAVLLCRYGLDQLLHPADLRGHLLSQDVVAVFQAPKLALEDVGRLCNDSGFLLTLLALSLSALQLLANVAQVAGDALVLLLVPTLLLLVDGQQRCHVLAARALIAFQLLQAFLCRRDLLEHLGEALKVDVGVVGWHAGVGLDSVLLQTSGLQAPALRLVVSLLLSHISPLNHLERLKKRVKDLI